MKKKTKIPYKCTDVYWTEPVIVKNPAKIKEIKKVLASGKRAFADVQPHRETDAEYILKQQMLKKWFSKEGKSDTSIELIENLKLWHKKQCNFLSFAEHGDDTKTYMLGYIAGVASLGYDIEFGMFDLEQDLEEYTDFYKIYLNKELISEVK